MTVTLDSAQVFDLECLPNVFTCCARPLFGDAKPTVWEISEFRDDRHYLRQWLNWVAENQIPLIGYNNESYDYPLLHLLFNSPNATYADLHAKSYAMINSGFGENRWAHNVWPRDRFAPQIDLMAMNRFNTQAKGTSLKALEFAMRRKRVVESRLPFNRPYTQDEINNDLIPYNMWTRHASSRTTR